MFRAVRRIVALLMLVGLLIVAGAALVIFRPAVFFGVDGDALESSVGGLTVGPGGSCRKLSSGDWSCSRWDEQMSGTVSYRVSVDRMGCWHAVRVGSPGEGSSRKLSGCIGILDVVFR